MTAPLLDMRNVCIDIQKTSGSYPVVRHLSLSIYPGEIVGLVGESGCGKSLTASSIPQLLPKSCKITNGEIWFEGENLLNYPDTAIQKVRGKRIGMVLQNPLSSLHPCLTIGEQIQEVLRQHTSLSKGEIYERTLHLLQQVGISDPAVRQKQYPHEFSGGMRQRVAIAIALAGKPSLLIADEPTTALDVTIQAQILALLQSIQQQSHMAILLISHDLGVIARLCHRVLVMYAGQIVESGLVEEIFSHPKHPYTQALIACKRSLTQIGQDSLFSIPGLSPTLSLDEKGCAFAPRCAYTMPICQHRMPSFNENLSGHQAACWLKQQGECIK